MNDENLDNLEELESELLNMPEIKKDSTPLDEKIKPSLCQFLKKPNEFI